MEHSASRLNQHGTVISQMSQKRERERKKNASQEALNLTLTIEKKCFKHVTKL